MAIKYDTLVILFCGLLVVHTYTAVAFQFSLPGQWASGAKRGAGFRFSLPGQWGSLPQKRGQVAECPASDPLQLRLMYLYLQSELEHVTACMQLYSEMEQENSVEPSA